MTTFRISSLYLYNHLILELPVTSGSCKSAPLVVVEEGETSDHVLRETVNTTGDVMANKLPESKHGKASIADLVGAADSHRFVVQWWPGSNLVTGVDAVREGVVDKANGKEGSNPELAGDYLDSLDTVRDILEGKAWVKLAWEAVKLRDDVTNYGKHRCAAIFDLPGTDEVESVLVDVSDKPRGSKYPTGAIAPISFSYPLRAVVCLPTKAGAKAEVVERVKAAMAAANFMLEGDCEDDKERRRTNRIT